MSSIVVIVPHPDDESALCGGLITRALRKGAEVSIVFVTSGTHGRTLGLCEQSDLAPERKKEAKLAAGILGVTDIRFLNYPDYDPRGQKKFDWPDAKKKLRACVEDNSIIVTFPPNGINGHPDHVRCSSLAREVAEEKDAALLYSTSAQAGTAYMMDAASYMKPQDRQKLYLPPTHVMKLTAEEMAAKLWALSHYRTQALSVVDLIRKMEGNFAQEYYALAKSANRAGEKFISALLRKP